MPRGRKPKETTVAVTIDHAKLLKQFKEEHELQLQTLYKDLATIKDKVAFSLRHVGLIDECDNIAEAAFKAGRAYGPLDEVNDKLETMLDTMYDNYDFDHWDDINDN